MARHMGVRCRAMKALRYGRPDVTELAIAEGMGVTRSCIANYVNGIRPWPAELSRFLLDDMKIDGQAIGRAMLLAYEAAEGLNSAPEHPTSRLKPS